MRVYFIHAYGIIFKIKKVVTGGYHAQYPSGFLLAPRNVYYSVTCEGVRIDNRLTLEGAKAAAKKAGLRMLLAEVLAIKEKAYKNER